MNLGIAGSGQPRFIALIHGRQQGGYNPLTVVSQVKRRCTVVSMPILNPVEFVHAGQQPVRIGKTHPGHFAQLFDLMTPFDPLSCFQ